MPIIDSIITVGWHIFKDKKIFKDFVDNYSTLKIFILENFCTNIRIMYKISYECNACTKFHVQQFSVLLLFKVRNYSSKKILLNFNIWSLFYNEKANYDSFKKIQKWDENTHCTVAKPKSQPLTYDVTANCIII